MTRAMALPVIWSARSIRDLEEIEAYIRLDAPLTAKAFAQKLFEAGNSLGDFPERGRRVSDTIREFVVLRPYVIRYRIARGAVRITWVRHGRRLA